MASLDLEYRGTEGDDGIGNQRGTGEDYVTTSLNGEAQSS